MNFKSFPFPVHLHNLHIVKVYVRFRLFFGIATLQIILLLCIPVGGGELRIWVGILVVLLRGVNFGFWSHLGCSGHMYIFSSLLGVKKSLGHAQIGLLYGFNSKFPTSIPTSFICGVLPPGSA